MAFLSKEEFQQKEKLIRHAFEVGWVPIGEQTREMLMEVYQDPDGQIHLTLSGHPPIKHTMTNDDWHDLRRHQ